MTPPQGWLPPARLFPPAAALAACLLGPPGPALAQAGDWNTVHRLVGRQIGDRFGYSIAGETDFDGDGVGDLVIGSDGYDFPGGGSDAGTAEVRSGRDGSVLAKFTSEIRGGRLGHAVAFAGDVNADGVPDIMAGAPFASFPGSTDIAGYVVVWSGADGSDLYEFRGLRQYDQLGHDLAPLGDVDGDGHDDFAIGVPWGTQHHFGLVRAHSGADGSLLWTFVGEEAWSGTGYALDPLDDLDGDGVGDLVVGAHGAAPLGAFADDGSVSVISGRTGRLIRHFGHDSLGEIHDIFGFAVSGAGDLDGDGYEDILVGAPFADPDGLRNAGEVFAYSVWTGALIGHWKGKEPFTSLGRAVLGPGDMDGDGTPDVVIGAGYLPPFPYVGEPYRQDQVYVYSGATHALVGAYAGPQGCDAPGQFLGYAGDLDGDGLPEVATGMPYPNRACSFFVPGEILVFGWTP